MADNEKLIEAINDLGNEIRDSIGALTESVDVLCACINNIPAVGAPNELKDFLKNDTLKEMVETLSKEQGT